jgi:hypothetical protein
MEVVFGQTPHLSSLTARVTEAPTWMSLLQVLSDEDKHPKAILSRQLRISKGWIWSGTIMIAFVEAVIGEFRIE